MALKIGDALLHLGVKDDLLKKGLKDSEGETRGWVSRVGGLAAKGVKVLGAAAVAGIVAIGAAAVKAAFDAMPLEGIRDAFNGITADAGETMQALREGSLGMVKDAELMASYNTAAQLVSKTFADQLPEAMQYLSKVSAATGQDMGYMIDSLVKGVGRMSPMILDNLGIQVSLSEAVAKAAEMFGVEEAALTKAQQQAGMMAVVMEKLAENTALMPEVTGSAAQQWAAFQTMMANAKDEIGLALLPILQTLIGAVGDLAKEWLPKLVDFIKGPVIETVTHVVDAFGGVAGAFAWARDEGKTLLESVLVGLAEFLDTFLPEEVMDRVWDFIDALADWRKLAEERVLPVVQRLWSWLGFMLPAAIETARRFWENTLLPAFEIVWRFISENVLPKFGEVYDWLQEKIPQAIETARQWWEETLKPALQTVWNYLEENVFPAFGTAYNWLKEKIPEAVEVARKWWEETFKPALKVVWDYLEENIFPAFETAYNWLKEKIPEAVEVVRKWWEETLQPALQVVRDYVVEEVVPKIKELAKLFEERFKEATEATATLWKETLKPALGTVWKFLTESVIPAFGDFVKQLDTEVTEAVETQSKLWEETFKPALSEVWRVISEDVYPIFEALAKLWKEVVGFELEVLIAIWHKLFGKLTDDVNPILKTCADIFRDRLAIQVKAVSDLLGGLYDTFSNIWTIISTKVVGAIESLTGWLAKLELPDWLKTKSPSLFETALRGIADALRDLVDNWLPRLSTAFGTRMRKMFESAKDIRGELQELFTIGGVFGGLASAAVSMLEARTLDPLRQAVESISEEMESLEEAGLTGAARYLELWEERERIAAQVVQHEERIAALQERQMELGFLQQQVELLKLIEDYDLHLEDILGGMELGIKANAADVLDAMVRAMQEVITVVEEELGISSPSKVFARLAQQAMEGFAQGVLQSTSIPVGALAGASQSFSKSVEQNFYIQRDAYPASTDSDLRADIRFLRFAGAGARSGA
ncbi:MAG TPA: hypothetical protein VMX14_03825 [Anaerolineae bacterium]|nr:hypothetical protein [Anaerolineae bacterium]